MAKYASGRFALRISDRSGMAFPYNEMVQEWNGSWVHISEFEAKQPQLDPRNHPTDFTALQHARPQVSNATAFVGNNTIRKATGEEVLSPNLDVYDGVGDGNAVNTFQTLEEPVTFYYANGTAYAGFQRSMMPLGLQRPMRTTGLLASVGNVTVTTS
jgi:hypothetical protein|tara:strand:+ start:1228 stop:1698 length:471 start_codon:yes stop_codon:yes gene_type:complete